MVGLGETIGELESTLTDLLKYGCDIVTIGQYLQPSQHHLPVERFVPPDEFAHLEQLARDLGFKGVASSPTVRSSYEAGVLYETVVQNFGN